MANSSDAFTFVIPTDAPTQDPSTAGITATDAPVVPIAVGASVGGLVLIVLLLVIVYVVRRRRGGPVIPQRKPVANPAALIYAGLQGISPGISSGNLAQVEALMDALVLSESADVIEVFNSTGGNSETVMRAVGLYLYSKNYFQQVFDHHARLEIEKATDPKVPLMRERRAKQGSDLLLQ